MRVLYVATDQEVPGTTGGSTHGSAIATGLSALGNEVHVVATAGEGGFPEGPVRWHAAGPPLGLRQLRFLRTRRIGALADAIHPDVIVERYYNFGGEGV